MIRKPLLLDGAMGTELQKRGINIPLPLWTADANINHSAVVTKIHKDYINAGSNTITANTFRSTSWTYRKTGLSYAQSKKRAKESLFRGIECANNASGGIVKVAGSITSVEDCYLPKNFPGRSYTKDVYAQTLDWMLDAGADIILFETMGNLEEIEIGLSLAYQYKIPIWLSIIMKDENRILDGTLLEQVIKIAKKYLVYCILTNCNEIDKAILTIEKIRSLWNGKWGVFPNLGITDYKNNYLKIIEKHVFTKKMQNILKIEPNIIGACCGSSPEHIKILNNLIERKNKHEIEN